MRIIREYQQFPTAQRGNVWVIGNFDGVHVGHQAVLKSAKQAAQQLGCGVMVMSFEPHPRHFFSPVKETLRVMPFHMKARQLQYEGVSWLLAQRFNAAFSQLTAQQFIEQVLIQTLGAAHVVTGEDFVFGHKRAGNRHLLDAVAKETKAFTYMALNRLTGQHSAISSSQLRQFIQAGDVAAAAAMLGRPYGWRGQVVHGAKRGRTIGFPTANLIPPPVLMPAFGVYAVKVSLEGSPTEISGVANLGVRPTVDGQTRRLEIHLFDTEIDLYGKRLHVDFISFIRPEIAFDGVDALRKQITADCQIARERLGVSH